MLRAMGWEKQPEISGLELNCGVPIHHAGYLPCPVISPEASLNLSPPNVSDKAQGNFLYDFLYNLNSASVWDEHFPLSLEGRKKSFKKYMAASVVKISSWQVTRIYRREKKKSLKLVSLWCGFFLHF